MVKVAGLRCSKEKLDELKFKTNNDIVFKKGKIII